jgi:adenylate cyclase
MLIDPVYPAAVIVCVYILATLAGYLETERRHRATRHMFARYVSPELVEQLARKDPDEIEVGGETRTMTLMFCDIRGFTRIAEGLDAQRLTRFVNEFLGPMSEAVLAHKGTIDKYIGDCIMAFWNAPLDDPQHARNAVAAARSMRARLAELNAAWRAQAEAAGQPFAPVRIGIGINTGQCCVGNMGSRVRLDYSVLGDPVNLASRLEGLTKLYGVDCVVSGSTVARVPDPDFIELDLVAVSGKAVPVPVYALLPDAAPAACAELLDLHPRMIAAYRRQDWDTALRLAERLAAAAPALATVYALYRDRIRAFRTAAPPPEWQAVHVAAAK